LMGGRVHQHEKQQLEIIQFTAPAQPASVIRIFAAFHSMAAKRGTRPGWTSEPQHVLWSLSHGMAGWQWTD
jgi:hypothetical protein